MVSTFHGIEVGKRGMQAHQQGLHVIEHNISNANTEGYSRQAISFETFPPLYVPGLSRENTPGQIGQGTTVQRIARVRNEFIDDRIMQEVSTQGYWDTMQFHFRQIEQIHNESSDQTVRTDLDQFWKSWQDLSHNPDDRASRAVVRETAVTLSRSIGKTFDRLYQMQSNIDTQIRLKVDEVNNYARQIAELNEQILRSQSVGDNPNDLMDKRDLLVEKLSGVVNVNVVRSDPDEFIVYVGSQYLVQGQKHRPMLAQGDAAKDGFAEVRWRDDGKLAKLESGALFALIELRDKVIAGQINHMDNMTANLTDLVNEVHRDGFGLNFRTGMDFFTNINLTQNRNGNYDKSGDGNEDTTILFKISGTRAVDENLEVGSAGILNFGPRETGGRDVTVSYAARDKIKDVIDRINKSDVGVVAYLNHRGRLAVKASLPKDPNHMKFVIRHLEDSGDFLVGISGLLRERGAAGSYDWQRINQVNQLVGAEKDYTVTPQYHPSRWVEVHQFIKNDLNNIAASQGTDTTGNDRFDRSNGVGDGNNALVIAKYRYGNGMIGENATFDEFFTALIGKLGSDSRDANVHLEKSNLVMQHLEKNRKAVSGVSYDEELANMVKMQQGYNATARLIRTFDQMLETVIGLVRG